MERIPAAVGMNFLHGMLGDASAAIAGGFLVLFLLYFAFIIFCLVYWIMKIVQVAQIPDVQFKAAGQEKVVWLLVTILLGIIGALIWRFAAMKKVLAAQGFVPNSFAPGWYPDPSTGHLRWFDGAQWGAFAPPGQGGPAGGSQYPPAPHV